MRRNPGETDPLNNVVAWRDGHIVALDQTALPHEFRLLHITTVDELVDAITRLAIRGAPALGVAGALGVALAVRQADRQGWDAARLDTEVKRIGDARPTAVNLRREVLAAAAAIARGPAAVEAAAIDIRDTAVSVSRHISERGARYLSEPGGGRAHRRRQANGGQPAPGRHSDRHRDPGRPGGRRGRGHRRLGHGDQREPPDQ